MFFRWYLNILFLAGALVITVMANDEAEGEGEGEGEERGCNRLQAAFSFRDTDFFVYGGNRLAGYSSRGRELYWGHVEDIGFNQTVTSAFGDTTDDVFYLQSGSQEQGFDKFHDELSGATPLMESGAEDVLRQDSAYQGVDAAFLRGPDHVIYLAGCQYVVVDIRANQVVRSGTVDEMGLPCSPDAAWSSPSLRWAFIAKGHTVYPFYWIDRRALEGESIYRDFYYLRDLNLC